MAKSVEGVWTVSVTFTPVVGEPCRVTHVVNDAVAATVDDFAAMSAQVAYDKVVETLMLNYERDLRNQ